MLFFAILLAFSLVGAGAVQMPPVHPQTAIANDNRVAAGTLQRHVLHLSMEARWGTWYPDGTGHAGIPMQAFAEVGKAQQIPGPLIRVPIGTQVVLGLRNSIPGTVLTVHGMVDRPADRDRPLSVSFGSSRLVRFRAGAAGTYAYWATTTSASSISNRQGWDSQLSGAIVVDTAESARDSRNDRIFVIGTWLNVFDAAKAPANRYAIETFNGRAWPYTERLSYRQGAVIHWRFINAGAANHPLHLHGFYFRIDSRGDGIGEIDYLKSADRDLEVTELVRPGGTFAMTWQAERPGNWLFHCHIPAHAAAHLPVADMLAGKPILSDAQYLNAYLPHAAMGGLIFGVTIRPALSWHALAQMPVRRLTLLVEPAPGNLPTAPAFRYVFEDGATRSQGNGHVGPPLVLTQGEPVAIDIKNHLSEPTSVHWHGIELADSYYDGAGGFSGYANHIAPMIAPGATFEVQLAPPRAGTFAYHTHLHDVWQFRGGLAGPLIVLPRGSRFDPSTDHTVMLTSPTEVKDLFSHVFINGEFDPPTMVVRAGVPQRLRLLNMATGGALNVISLDSTAGPISWRPVAIDGADLPRARRVPEPSVQTLTLGKTLDFQFTPTMPGDLTLVVRSRSGRILGKLTIRVI